MMEVILKLSSKFHYTYFLSSTGLLKYQWNEKLRLTMTGKNFSRPHILKYFSCIFPKKQVLKFHANCLRRRQTARNVKAYFLGKIRKMSPVCHLLNSNNIYGNYPICSDTFNSFFYTCPKIWMSILRHADVSNNSWAQLFKANNVVS